MNNMIDELHSAINNLINEKLEVDINVYFKRTLVCCYTHVYSLKKFPSGSTGLYNTDNVSIGIVSTEMLKSFDIDGETIGIYLESKLDRA